MRYVIGIDIGTTNTKAVAIAPDGVVLATTSAGYAAFSDADGRHELDPDHLMGAVRESLAGVVRQVDPAPEGIGFSCAFHSLLAVDESGKPMTRAMTWADLRPAAEAKALKATEAGMRIYRHTGTPLHAMSPLCKLLWLRARQPQVFGRAARFIGIKEYIWWRLFGRYEIDHSIASATGLFDIRGLDWYGESLELAGITPSRLSSPVPCTHQGRGLLPGVLAGIADRVPFIIGGGDGCLANLGSGAIRPGDTALTIGTSGAIRMTARTPEDDSKGRIFTYIMSPGRYACGGATNNGGNVLKWLFEKILGVEDEQEWEGRVEAAAELAPGCEGLICLPYLQGERAPVWDAEARGVFFGLRSIHDHRHFIRACLEGVCYSLCEIGASLEETIGPIADIYASGGFTRSETWVQMLADIFDKNVHVSHAADASAAGAAILAMLALGQIPDTDAATGLVKVRKTYEPDPARHVLYRKNYEVFTQLYSRLRDLE
ncbi:MAG TPA: gluconokinase [Puia sp.]|nr:gluconokinase [Puia sp.]